MRRSLLACACHAMPRHATPRHAVRGGRTIVRSFRWSLCVAWEMPLVCDICWARRDVLQSAFSMLERHVASGMMQPNMLPDAHLQPNMLHAAC